MSWEILCSSVLQKPGQLVTLPEMQIAWGHFHEVENEAHLTVTILYWLSLLSASLPLSLTAAP